MSLVETLLPPLVELLGMVSPVLQMITPLLQMFSELLQPIAALFMELISTLLPPMLSLFSDLAAKVLPPLMDILNVIFTNVLMPLIPVITEIVQAILPLLLSYLELVGGLFGLIVPILEALSPVLEVIGFVLGVIAEALSKVIGWLADGVGKVVGFFSNLFGGAKESEEAVEGLNGAVNGLDEATSKETSLAVDTSEYAKDITSASTEANKTAQENIIATKDISDLNLKLMGTEASSTYSTMAIDAEEAWGRMVKAADTGAEKIVEAFQKIAAAAKSVSSANISVTGAEIPHNATGTDNFKGGWTHINESGGELAFLPSGSAIIPADKTDRIMPDAPAVQKENPPPATVVEIPAPVVNVEVEPVSKAEPSPDRQIAAPEVAPRQDAAVENRFTDTLPQKPEALPPSPVEKPQAQPAAIVPPPPTERAVPQERQPLGIADIRETGDDKGARLSESVKNNKPEINLGGFHTKIEITIQGNADNNTVNEIKRSIPEMIKQAWEEFRADELQTLMLKNGYV
jgi:hypothetical protein